MISQLADLRNKKINTITVAFLHLLSKYFRILQDTKITLLKIYSMKYCLKYFCMCFKNIQISHLKFYYKITDVINYDKEITLQEQWCIKSTE